jgi:hypothetical protein
VPATSPARGRSIPAIRHEHSNLRPFCYLKLTFSYRATVIDPRRRPLRFRGWISLLDFDSTQ